MSISPTRVVTVSRPGLPYFDRPPFSAPNPVYAAVEAIFRGLGLDTAHAGTSSWNPLGDLISPGDRVVVKPNLVSSKDLHRRIQGPRLLAASTHGSVLRPVLDYALRATGSRGHVRVVDAPVEGCEVEKVAEPLGIFAVIDHLRREGHDVAFVDLRHFRMRHRFVLDDACFAGRSYNLGLLLRQPLEGDPRGYRVVDLGGSSFFARDDAPEASRLRFHRSHYKTPVPHHEQGRHEYSLSQTVLDADVIVSLPKFKTHKKTGVTLALKSAIGLSSEKYWLPHFSEGDPRRGGDELQEAPTRKEIFARRLGRLPLWGGHSLIARAPRLDAKPDVVDGGWEGNDTLWRTVLDLNRILFFADRSGTMKRAPQRRALTIVDGIVGGEGEGPLGATPVHAGILVGGCDPSLVDAVATEAMGFRVSDLPLVREALGGALLPSGRLELLERIVDGPAPSHSFVPPRSWPSLARTSRA